MASKETNGDPRVSRNINFGRALKTALHGIGSVIKNERAMRLHLFCATVFILAGVYFGLSRSEWIWLIIVIFWFFYCEFLNTAIELIVDLIVEKKYHPIAGLAKDVGGGIVDLAMFMGLIVVAFIFQPHIWHQLGWSTQLVATLLH
ncbi:diacylglycerol kinase family protein [Convivina intestini]|uniref:diacylglycerol kinase family protein n=1 Tax=Convivina intestini TaxID=1505726 RepID=UPI00201091A8|nr:diacylglycerol kinase family protein [Convivina intestini]CAH1852003.1 Undecaprenol kinase [Convivina intestini]